jgi:hypothetical protein
MCFFSYEETPLINQEKITFTFSAWMLDKIFLIIPDRLLKSSNRAAHNAAVIVKLGSSL